MKTKYKYVEFVHLSSLDGGSWECRDRETRNKVGWIQWSYENKCYRWQQKRGMPLSGKFLTEIIDFMQRLTDHG